MIYDIVNCFHRCPLPAGSAAERCPLPPRLPGLAAQSSPALPGISALTYTAAMITPRFADNFVPLAWNGLHLSHPPDWQPARLGLRYLLLADAAGPVFEFKWRPGAGRKGMEAALRALTPKGRAKTGMSLPAAWLDALDAYELMPLSWTCDGQSGLGAALFHPETGTAAVFQAYGGPDGLTAARQATVAAVLAGLRHDLPGPPDFRLYGLSFAAPPDFALASFTFVPGRFSLRFIAGRRHLDVVRVAPAEVYLARDTLGAIAALTFGFDASVRPEPTTLAGVPAVWLASHQGTGWPDRVRRALGRPGRLAVVRHESAVDKLLGAAVTSKKPVDRQWLAAVAAGCVSL